MKNLKRQALYAALFSGALLLSACGGDSQDISLDSVPPSTEQSTQIAGNLVFDPIESVIPYPNDILFAGSTDGTLNLPVDDATDIADPKNALNALDGFSTSGPISVSLSKAFEADNTELASAVKVYEVTTDMATKAVTGIVSTLAYGVDFAASIVNETTLAILPLKPLSPQTSYMVVVTNALTDSDGLAAEPSQTYHFLKQSTPLIDASGNSITPGLPTSFAVKLEPIRQLTQAQLGYAVAQGGLDLDKIVMSWSFSTQSVGTVLETVASSVSNQTLAVQAANGMTTAAVGGDGKGDIYMGTVTVPYYSAVPSATNPTAPLVSHWTGQTGEELTRYSVAQGDSPKKVADQTIPVLMTLPNADSGQEKPASGWPVVIFQHGITGNRSHALAIADSLAAAGYAMVAIDLPMHGITSYDDAAALRIDGVTERTFDLDLVAQDATGGVTSLGPDGAQDSSGRHFIQLTSLLTTRDNLRQGISDLVQLKAALANIQGADLDASNISFVGHSLGGMVGAGFVKRATDLQAAVFAMSGTQASYLLANSASFAPEIEAGLASNGITAGSADYYSFLLAAQTAIDSGDPVNMVSEISVPTLMLEVVGDGNSGTDDQVIPNSVATAPLAGTEPWIRLQSLTALNRSAAVADGKAVMRFTAGDHGSLLSPTADLTTTRAMQEAMASFIATKGTAVQVTDSATIQ